jgi:hypothetical protein
MNINSTRGLMFNGVTFIFGNLGNCQIANPVATGSMGVRSGGVIV